MLGMFSLKAILLSLWSFCETMSVSRSSFFEVLFYLLGAGGRSGTLLDPSSIQGKNKSKTIAKKEHQHDAFLGLLVSFGPLGRRLGALGNKKDVPKPFECDFADSVKTYVLHWF